jgi:hypothetical protein
MDAIRDQLKDLLGGFDGADLLQKEGIDTWGVHRYNALDALIRLETLSAELLEREQGGPGLSADGVMDVEVPDDEAQS